MNYNEDYFSGKTAVVTGAASGIGLALVEELLMCNAAKVVMADINRERLKEHEERLKQIYGNRVKGIWCDVTLEENVKNLIAESTSFFDGKFDLLINNAGAGFTSIFAETTNEQWKFAFDLNFYAALWGMREVLPIMYKQGSGQIINIISGIAFIALPYQSLYSATKSALNALSLALRYEYGDYNIKISSATPGTTATAIWGDGPVPDSAQSPQQSARRILNGAANNDRIIMGDDSDAKYAKKCFDVAHQSEMDEFVFGIARARRRGEVGY